MTPTPNELLAFVTLVARMRASQVNCRPSAPEWRERLDLERQVDEALARLNREAKGGG